MDEKLINKVFEPEQGCQFIDKYKRIISENKYSTDDFVYLFRKLCEVIELVETIGKNECKYKFVNYRPGFVDGDPYFFYFNEEEDLLEYMKKLNPYWETGKILIKWNIDDQKVLHDDGSGQAWVIGFIRNLHK